MMHFLKFFLVFVLGAALTVAGVRFVLKAYNPNVLSAHTALGGPSSEQSNFVSRFIYDQLLPQIAQSPALAPIFETKRNVEGTVEAVSTLPEEQKKAVCQELCGPVLQPNRATYRPR